MPLHSVRVADPGKGLGGPPPPPPSLFFTKLRPDGPKKNLWKTPPPPLLFQGLDDLPSSVIWICHGNYKPFYRVQG